MVAAPGAAGRGCDGDPDAALNRSLAAVQPNGSPDDLEQPSHDLRDAPLVRDVLEQNRELVAAQPGHGVADTQRRPHARGDGLQHPVAGVVAERVVDDLEVVEVQEQHGERLTVRASAAERVFDAIPEQRPVREVGHWIVERLVGELLLQLLALGDIAQVDDDPANRGVLQQVGEQTLGVQQATIAVTNTKLERLRGLRRARQQRAERRLDQRSVLFGDVVQESSADEVRGFVSENLANRRTRVLDGQIGREHEDHIARMLDQRAQADLALGAQHALAQHGSRAARWHPAPARARSSARRPARIARSPRCR